LVWQVDGCDLLIAPDTGPVHIARALGVPVVGLYGHTNPWRVGPYRRYQDLWVDRYTDEGEAPDASRWDPKLDRMGQITVDDVLDRVQRFADAYGDVRRKPDGPAGAAADDAGAG
ncbi:MAG TPA: glycosyltransferase family 9 protein, partial [Longimicrobiaceae bacterium]|nr:glycosyltransferase family 9 protein [Longimicrobiaceae bacterium]